MDSHIYELEERVARLERLVRAEPEIIRLRGVYLNHHNRVFLSALMRTGSITRERLYDLLWGHLPNPPKDVRAELDVIASRLRLILSAYGVKFETIRGYGFSMKQQYINKLRELQNEPAIQ